MVVVLTTILLLEIMSKIKIAINGFGRIGRNLFKLLHNHPSIEVVAINDLADVKTMAHLLKYDSIHGIFKVDIKSTDNQLIIDNKPVAYFSQKEIAHLPWKELSIDFVIESTGKRKTYASLKEHLTQGAKRVILSVPPEDNAIKTIVLGVNEQILTEEELIVSNASCTTNNAAPMVKIIKELCGIEPL